MSLDPTRDIQPPLVLYHPRATLEPPLLVTVQPSRHASSPSVRGGKQRVKERRKVLKGLMFDDNPFEL